MASLEDIVDEIQTLFADTHPEAIPHSDIIKRIVGGVIAARRISIGDVGGVAQAVTLIESAIKDVQKSLGKPQSGLLGLPGLKEFEELFDTCLSKSPARGAAEGRPTLKPSANVGDPVLVRKASRTFVYQIDGSLPVILPDPGSAGPAKQAAELIDEAFFVWKEKVDIETRQLPADLPKADAERLANLVLKATEIDGANGKLAESTFNVRGTAGVLQGNLDLIIDKSEGWTESKFKSAMIHEIGHLLGLDHEESPSSIMFFQLTGATTLQDGDAAVQKALTVWEKSNFAPEVPRQGALV